MPLLKGGIRNHLYQQLWSSIQVHLHLLQQLFVRCSLEQVHPNVKCSRKGKQILLWKQLVQGT